MNQGDIYSVNLNPAAGHEQSGRRPVMVVSLGAFNKINNIPFVVPITTRNQFASRKGFSVPLLGCSKTQGFVLCNHIRAIDLNARQAEYIESAPTDVIEEVLQKIITFMVQP